jgi:hypothetical protein
VKKLLTIACLTIASTGFSQNLGIEVFAGTSNYQGDLLESRYTFKGSKLALGAGLSYALTNHFTARAMFMYGQIGADDKNNQDPFLINRNLNFKTSIFEFGVQGLYHILNTDYNRINPYLMAGISLFHFNPYTYDTLGSKYYLKPLSTEGQGLPQYPDRKEYSLTQISIPFGAGIKFSVTESISIAWEIGLRKTFTDHLDDLSTTYPDEAILLAERGPKAVELSYRGGEIKTGNPVFPAEGTIRGGPDFKDWYYFSGIHATFKINDPSFGGKNRTKGSKTSCPGPVY